MTAMHPSRLLVGSCLVLAACSEEPVIATWLDEIERLELSASVEHGYDGARVRATVTGAAAAIHLEGFAIRVGDYPSLPGNSTRDPGSTSPDFPADPRIEMLIPPEHRSAGADLAITDGRTTLTLPLGDALVPRRGEWLVPADGVVGSGDAIEIRWTPASDLAVIAISALMLDGNQYRDPVIAASTDGVLRGTAAPDLSVAGPGELSIHWNKPRAEQTCLDGTCSLAVSGFVRLPMQIVAPDAP